MIEHQDIYYCNSTQRLKGGNIIISLYADKIQYYSYINFLKSYLLAKQILKETSLT